MGVFSGIAILKSVEGNIVRVPGSRLSLADQEVLIDWLEFERQMPSVILTKVDHDILKAGLRQRELTKLGYRVWKSSKFSTQAHLSGFSNGIAYLKAPNGKILKVPYSDLSPDDQAFIDNWKKR